MINVTMLRTEVPEIKTSQTVELGDPKLREIAKRVVKTMQMSAEKAVAHHVDPTNFPVASDPNSLEQIFLSRFRKLHPVKQQAAALKVMNFIHAPAEVRVGVYDNLAKVNLRSVTPVETQAENIEFPSSLKFPLTHLHTLTVLPGRILLQLLGGSSVGPINPLVVEPIHRPWSPTPTSTIDKLELRIHSVKCVDETGGGWGGEWGEDEIYLGGTAVDESGDMDKIPEFKVGDFDDGSEKIYAIPKQFTWFDLREGTEWPKSYFVTLVLAEQDEGGLAEFLNKLLEKVKEKVISAISTAIGAAIGASGGIVGAAIGAVVGWAVGEIFEWLKSWWSDDIFQPITVSTIIPSLEHRFAGGATDSSENVITFKGHDGEYQLKYDWRVFS